MYTREEEVRDIRAWIASGHRRDVRIAAAIADETASLRNQSVMAGLGIAVGLVAAVVAPFHHVPALPFLLLVGIAAALWSVRIARRLVIADRRASHLPRFIGGIERDAVLKYPDVLARARANVEADEALRHTSGGVHAPIR